MMQFIDEKAVFEEAMDDLLTTVALVNACLSHTVYALELDPMLSVDATAGLLITLRLSQGHPIMKHYCVECRGLPMALRSAWQLCAVALWWFSQAVWPLPPWELGQKLARCSEFHLRPEGAGLSRAKTQEPVIKE